MKDRKLRKALSDLGLVNFFDGLKQFGVGRQISDLVTEQNETLTKLYAIREQIDALVDYFDIEFEVMPKKLKVVPRRTV